MSLPLAESPIKDQVEAPPALQQPTAPAACPKSPPPKANPYVVKGAAAAALINQDLARLAVGVCPPTAAPRPGSPLGAAQAPGSPRLGSAARLNELLRMVQAVAREIQRMSTEATAREGGKPRASEGCCWSPSPRT